MKKRALNEPVDMVTVVTMETKQYQDGTLAVTFTGKFRVVEMKCGDFKVKVPRGTGTFVVEPEIVVEPIPDMTMQPPPRPEGVTERSGQGGGGH